MESKNELNEIDIKSRTSYYFDDTIRAWDIDSGEILLSKCLNLWLFTQKFYVFNIIAY